MSAEVLREAARLMREDWPTDFTASFCQCEESDDWFDRSICSEPCGSMHYVCVDCGRIKGHCAVAVQAGETSTRLARSWLAVADLLDAFADTYRAARFRAFDEELNRQALAVAVAYLGTAPSPPDDAP